MHCAVGLVRDRAAIKVDKVLRDLSHILSVLDEVIHLNLHAVAVEGVHDARLVLLRVPGRARHVAVDVSECEVHLVRLVSRLKTIFLSVLRNTQSNIEEHDQDAQTECEW